MFVTITFTTQSQLPCAQVQILRKLLQYHSYKSEFLFIVLIRQLLTVSNIIPTRALVQRNE